MPIGSTLDLVIQQDDLIVLGPPSSIDVVVDIGPRGFPGGQSYTGAFDPNSVTPDEFKNIYGDVPRIGDLFLRNDAGPNYGSFYQYSIVPGGEQWEIVVDLVNVAELFFSSNPVILGTNTTGNYVQSVSASGNGISVTGTGEGAAVTVANTGVTSVASTTNQVVVSASTGAVTLSLPATINVNTSGNAATATALATARNINLSGDVVGSASFDGSGSVNISTTIQPDSVALGTDTTGNYVQSVSASGNGISVTGTGEGAAVTVANTGVTSVAGTTNQVVVSASTGAVTLSLPATINANISGNAATVSAVPARIINQKTNSYTLQLADAQNILEFNSASAMILTIPEDSSVNFPVGSYIDIVQTGNAEVEVQGNGVVTLLSKNSETKTSGQYSRVYLYKQSSNTWILTGDLSS